MYQQGQYIIYGNTGVCQVTDIIQKSTESHGLQDFYVLKPAYSDYTITTPVNGGRVFMRPVISADEAHALIDSIPSIHAEAYHNRVLRQLSDHYDELLLTHSCLDLVKLTMSIYAKRQLLTQQKKRLGAVDEKYSKKAEDLLFGELAAALGIEKGQVQEYIAARLETVSD